MRKKPESSSLTNAMYRDRDGYVLPSRSYTISQMRALIRDPLVYRAIVGVEQAVSSHDWHIEVPGKASAEEMVNLMFGLLWEKLVRGALRSVWYGSQVMELYFPLVEDGYYWPSISVPPMDYVVLRTDDNGNYAGFKQTVRGLDDVRVDRDYSTLFSWCAVGNDLYGLGALETVYPYVINAGTVNDQIETMAERQNWPMGIIGVPGDGRSSDAGRKAFADDIAALPSKEIPILSYMQYSGNPVTLNTVQPVQGAIQDALKAVDVWRREIALGLLVSLRTFYNSPMDGGSYSLTQVQQSEFDRIVEGIWRGLMPGITEIISRVLEANWGSCEFELQLEHTDDLSLENARQTLQGLLDQAAPHIDIPALVEQVGLPLVEGESVVDSSTAGRRSMIDMRGLESTDPTEVRKTARKIKAEFDRYYDREQGRLEKALGGDDSASLIRAAVKDSLAHGKAIYRAYMGALPELPDDLSADYRRRGSVLASRYKRTVDSITEDYDSMALRYPPEVVDPKRKNALKNAARKVADKAAKAGAYLFADLSRVSHG